MQTTIQTNDPAALDANISRLEARIQEMKTTLPFIKNFAARRAVGTSIRRFQNDIFSMKREIFKFRH